MEGKGMKEVINHQSVTLTVEELIAVLQKSYPEMHRYTEADLFSGLMLKEKTSLNPADAIRFTWVKWAEEQQ